MRSKKFLLGAFTVILLVVGLTSAIFLSQKRQETRSHASASTSLSFAPLTTSSSPIRKNTGDNVSMDVMVDPGTNRPSLIKLEIDYDPTVLTPTSSPFTVNTTAFPETREGPFVQNGKILISVAVGSDPTKAIAQVTKVGTVNFTATSPTAVNSSSQLSFGSTSQVLSVGSGDQANENVLSTTSPAFIAIASAPLPTPTPLPPTPTPTPVPANQSPTIRITNPLNGTLLNTFTIPVTVSANDPDGQVVRVDYYLDTSLLTNSTSSPFSSSITLPHTDSCYTRTGTIKAVATDNKGGTSFDAVTINWNDGCPPTPTPTPLVPTPTPSPTSTPVPNAANLSFSVLMHGVGNGGDNVNPNLNSLSNKNPLHKTRDMKVEILDSLNNLIDATFGSLVYDPTAGDFKGSIAVNNFPGTGTYTIKVTSSDHLRRAIPGIQNIIVGQNNSTPQISLIAGDANDDNAINILDYNLLTGCYSDLAPATYCSPQDKLSTDLNDDGNVNQTDYNLFLREITVQNGQ